MMAQVFETIHKDSCQCGKSELDLFTVPATQVDIDPVSSIAASDTIESLSVLQIRVFIPIWQTVIFMIIMGQ